MFLTILAATDAGSVVVAVAIIVLIGAITLVAMLKYDIDAALKVWAALGTVTGLVVGSMGTYFFTKRPALNNKLRARRHPFGFHDQRKPESSSSRPDPGAGGISPLFQIKS